MEMVFNTAFGGSLNKEGTKYYRILMAAEKNIAYLEDLKQYLSEVDQKKISEAIEVITNHINKIIEESKVEL